MTYRTSLYNNNYISKKKDCEKKRMQKSTLT
jgi:hypothetical protein